MSSTTTKLSPERPRRGCTSDPTDPERVRFTFVSSLGDQPDEHELVLSVPRNIEFVTIRERE